MWMQWTLTQNFSQKIPVIGICFASFPLIAWIMSSGACKCSALSSHNIRNWCEYDEGSVHCQIIFSGCCLMPAVIINYCRYSSCQHYDNMWLISRPSSCISTLCTWHFNYNLEIRFSKINVGDIHCEIIVTSCTDPQTFGIMESAGNVGMRLVSLWDCNKPLCTIT